MPWYGLADNYSASVDLFKNTVIQERTRLHLLKRAVETYPSRFRHRIATSGRIASTDYSVVWEELNVHRFALLSFLIDAGGGPAKSHLDPLSSRRVLTDLKDRLHQENHKILVENHIYGFFWNPQKNALEMVMEGLGAAIKLAGSISTVVATGGATFYSVLDSLRDIASLSGDLITVCRESSEHLSSIARTLGEFKDQGQEMFSSVETISQALDRGEASSFSGLTGQVTRQEEGLSVAASSVAERSRIRGERQMVGGGLFSSPRLETVSEMQQRVRQELTEQLAQISKIMFVVVQQATPVVMHYEINDVVRDSIDCNIMFHAANKSMVRIGHTDLAKYERMVAHLERGYSDSDVLLSPWLVTGSEGFSQYTGVSNWTAYTDLVKGDYTAVDWDLRSSSTRWTDFKTIRNATIPLPESIVRGRVRLQGQLEQKKRDFEVIVQRKTQELASRWRARTLAAKVARINAAQAELEAIRHDLDAFVQAVQPPLSGIRAHYPAPDAGRRTADTKALCVQMINEAVRRSELPSPDAFVQQTEIVRMGMFKAARKNPYLLQLDQSLTLWAEKYRSTYQEPMEYFESCAHVLAYLVGECNNYLREKERSSSSADRSVRIPAVRELKRKAEKTLDDMAVISAGWELISQKQWMAA